MPAKLPPDYHVHAPYCGHAAGPMIAYVEHAIALGIPELCFTDHLGRYYLSDPQKERFGDWGMDRSLLERYVREVHMLAHAFSGDISIKLGLEIDYVEGAEDRLGDVLRGIPFDFFLGSIHVLPEHSWFSIANYEAGSFDPISVARSFFAASKACIASGLFDSLSHPDFLWRYGAWPSGHHEEMAELIDDLASFAASRKHAVEINGNGYMWSQLHYIETGDPFEQLLQACARHKTPITLGSDAHAPQHTGKRFPEIVEELRLNGLHTIRTFAQHRPSALLLDTCTES